VYQELMWDLKPKRVIEGGVARGGGVVFSASILKLLGGDGEVLGVDIDIRAHNRSRIEAHPTFDRVSLIEGDSTSLETHSAVQQWLNGRRADIIVLDSNHTHQHVLAELELFAPYLRDGGYFVLPDTVIEFFPEGYFSDRPWDRGNNPLTAVREFLSTHEEFELDAGISSKAAISESPFGYLRKKSLAAE
jgi:cephalosporin hydroxylase